MPLYVRLSKRDKMNRDHDGNQATPRKVFMLVPNMCIRIKELVGK